MTINCKVSEQYGPQDTYRSGCSIYRDKYVYIDRIFLFTQQCKKKKSTFSLYAYAIFNSSFVNYGNLF